jgi:4-amino-4-deoxy-L-arabinose transferase-like glycosyltransferase
VLRHTKAISLTLFVFFAAFLPRLVALSAFLTADEYLWVTRSREFLLAILNGEWEGTLQSEHPGVTTMWTGTFGILYRYWTRTPQEADSLLAFVQQVPSFPPHVSYIAPMRFPTVLLMALFIALFYALVTHLFDDKRVGLMAALLLAFNPYHIALSRVLHHDALETAFMTLALLTLLGYFFKEESAYWLYFSAIMTGLALLSKSPALFLLPFFALLSILWAIRRSSWSQARSAGWSDLGHLAESSFFWGGMVWLTIFLLWPAIRVDTLSVLNMVFEFGTQHATEGHGWGNFFWGEISHDPGFLFYPVNWLLRTTPLQWLGLVSWAAFFVRHLRHFPQKRPFSWTLSALLLLYVLLFVVMMSIGAKKQDPYILPIYPELDILAAWGLIQLLSIQKIANVYVTEKRAWAFILAGFVLQIALLVSHYPYYFTYYNPLLGGAPTAARLTTVGWGEGLDQAAHYLNRLPHAEQLQVVAWYSYSFSPFFRGQTFHGQVPFVHEVFVSDVAVIYRNQIQRNLPNAHLIRYLQRHQRPVFTVTLQGVEYVYLYQIPLTQRTNWQSSHLAQKVILFGIDDSKPDSLTLYWQNQGLPADEEWWLALEGKQNAPQAWQPCQLKPNFAKERLITGALLESECPLATTNMEPGIYELQLAVGANSQTISTIPLEGGELELEIRNGGNGD